MVYRDFFFNRHNAPAPLPTRGIAGFSRFLPDDPKNPLSYDVPLCAALAFRRTILQRLLLIPLSLIVQADAHLGACVILVAPIVSSPSPSPCAAFTGQRVELGRQYPTGCAILGGDAAAKTWLERRVQTTRAIAKVEIQSRAGEFALSPPGRLRFFRHLVEQLWDDIELIVVDDGLHR